MGGEGVCPLPYDFDTPCLLRLKSRHLRIQKKFTMTFTAPRDFLLNSNRSQRRDDPQISMPAAPCQSSSLLGTDYRRMATLIHAGKDMEACRRWSNITPFGAMLAFLGDPEAEHACPALPKQHPFPGALLMNHLAALHPDILHQPLSGLPRSGRNAVVIGSGPAGLQAAWSLRAHGFDVTLLEAAPVAGITLLHPPLRESGSDAPGFPPVPAEIMERIIAVLSLSGIVIKTSCPTGQADLARLCDSHDVVLCACGRGAVLPADRNGKVNDRLFAAGACVKNKKHLGLLEAIVSGRNAAESAFRILEHLPLPEADSMTPTLRNMPEASSENASGYNQPGKSCMLSRQDLLAATSPCLACRQSDQERYGVVPDRLPKP